LVSCHPSSLPSTVPLPTWEGASGELYPLVRDFSHITDRRKIKFPPPPASSFLLCALFPRPDRRALHNRVNGLELHALAHSFFCVILSAAKKPGSVIVPLPLLFLSFRAESAERGIPNLLLPISSP
jgi:hypothetical protein